MPDPPGRARAPPGARVAGLSVPNGIVLVGQRAWGAARIEPDGTIRPTSGLLAPAPAWQRVPLVRVWTGLLRQGAATKTALASMRGRHAPAAWKGVAVMLVLQAFLAFAGLDLGLTAGAYVAERGWPAWTAIPLGLGAVFALMTTAVALASRQPRLAGMYRLHGAEHRVIHALEHGLDGWRATHRGMRKEHLRCGTGWMFILLTLPFAVGVLLRAADAPPLALPLAWLLLFLFGQPLLGELSAAPGVQKVLAAPGLVLQRFTTLAPTEQEALVAEAAATALVQAATADPRP